MTDQQTKEIKKVDPGKSKKDKKPKVKSPFRRQRIVATILIVITSLGVVGASGVGLYAFAQIKKAPDLSVEQFVSDNSSIILDKDGNEIYDTGKKKRNNTTYAELSTSLVDAFVAAEDSRFFSHNGFDIPRFTRAALNNLKRTVTTGSLDFSEGGSTFTMQLIKNTAFVEEGSGGAEGGSGGIPRKIQEIYLSQKLENEGMLSKQLILELYLNMIDFGVGSNIVGVEKSAQTYFGKSASELNTVESAFMAGVINAPFANSPYYSIERANKATRRVLGNMLQHGYITQEEYDVSVKVNIEDLLIERDTNIGSDYPNQAFVDTVVNEVISLTGENPYNDGNMIIHTTMVPEVQSAIDAVQRREVEYLDFGSDNDIQAASAVVNNQTGEIVGLFGGYDYNGERLRNRASEAKRSPGSTLKPLVSYAPAYEYLGWATDHVIEDGPLAYAGGLVLNNYDGRYMGQIDLNYAIGDSRNVPAMKSFNDVYDTIGREAYITYLNNIGLEIDKENFSAAYSIGANTFEVSTTQIAGATATVFNEGQYIKPHTVLKIEYTDGREPYIPDYTPVQAMSPGAAYMTSRGMKYVVDSGLNAFTNPVRRWYTTFAKTGTNGFDDNTADILKIPRGSEKDRLMTTATDQFTISTWVGWDENHSKAYFSESERQFNFPANFNSYILDVLEDKFGQGYDISAPGDVVQLTHIKGPYPYQAPLADMNPDLISTGWILSKYATLTDATPQELKALASQSVDTTSNGNQLNFKITMSEYPDKEKLTVATSELVMQHPNGGTVTGTRVFDESWIYGAVRYKTDLYVNDTLVKESTSESNVMNMDYTYSSSTNKIELCSYYTFEKSLSRKSNEKCTTISSDKFPTPQIEAPNFIGQSLGHYLDWAAAYSIKDPSLSYELSGDAYDTVIAISPLSSGKTYTEKQLNEMNVKITLADVQVSSGITLGDFKTNFGHYLNIGVSDPNATDESIVTGFRFGTSEVNSFHLSQRVGEGVEVILKQGD